MTTAAEAELTREGLIWRIAEVIGRSEGKPFTSTGEEKNVTREYLLDLIAATVAAVDGKRYIEP